MHTRLRRPERCSLVTLGAWLASLLIVLTAVITSVTALLGELSMGEPSLRGLVHAGVMLLFVSIHLLETHPIGTAFVGISCAMLARAAWVAAPISALVLLAAAPLALATLPGGLSPSTALLAAASALTLAPISTEVDFQQLALASTVAPAESHHASGDIISWEIIISAIAAAFHRSFICALGTMHHARCEPTALVFIASACMLSACFATHARTASAPDYRAALLATLSAILRVPTGWRIFDAHVPPRPPLVPSPAPALAYLRGGWRACLACTAYAGALFAEAFYAGPAQKPLSLVLTRTVHVSAVLGFVAAISPRALQSLPRATKALITCAAATDVTLCLCRAVGVLQHQQSADATASSSPSIRWLLLARALGAVGTAATFLCVEASTRVLASKPAAIASDGAAAVGGAVDDGFAADGFAADGFADDSADARYTRARRIAGLATFVYLVVHGLSALQEATVEASISSIFHWVVLVSSFASWAALYCDAMVLWLARIFVAIEVLTISTAKSLELGFGVQCSGVSHDVASFASTLTAPHECPTQLRDAAALVFSATLLLGALATVPVTQLADSSFLSFDHGAHDEISETRRIVPPPRLHRNLTG